MLHHNRYMLRCIELALKGAGFVSPNPMVGAVLVHNNQIIGEGWHKQYGGPHAEVNCIASVAEHNRHLIAASTLYVSLEPCAHFGKTPPCANLILEHKIPHVVIGCLDTFSKVSGKGIALLQNAGVEVTLNILHEQCRKLNKRFFTYHELRRPYVVLKWAQSSDGFIAPDQGRKVMLSGWAAQRLVHKMRACEDAIMVGYRTALLDNPMLTNRLWFGHNPLRVVWDKYNSLPNDHHLKDGNVRTIIFTNNNVPDNAHTQLSYVQLPSGSNEVTAVLQMLYQQNVQSLIVEGGSDTLHAFIQAGFWDEAVVITATQCTIGSGVKAPSTQGFSLSKSLRLHHDQINFYTHESSGLFSKK
jgi:diaminohydroxyphosphoribosylaminopyrimidine deaminase/5-amino-6-(5-phosphoribosylamino)uracil reductase